MGIDVALGSLRLQSPLVLGSLLSSDPSYTSQCPTARGRMMRRPA